MKTLDISFLDPAVNILYDHFLFWHAEWCGGGEVLRLWESPRTCVVLGRVGSEGEDVDNDRARRDGVPVVRRASGGGTVLQGPGCLNFSFVVSKADRPGINDLRRSYQEILSWVVRVLAAVGCQARVLPVSDLALPGGLRKISGNAQYRGRRFILHHGTILYQFDLALIERYLRLPRSMPEYRAGRGHRDFVANISASSSGLRAAFYQTFADGPVITRLHREDGQAFLDFVREGCGGQKIWAGYKSTGINIDTVPHDNIMVNEKYK